MQIIVGGRATGKTHRLIQAAIRSPADSIILVAGAQEAGIMKDRVVQALEKDGSARGEAQRLADHMIRTSSHMQGFPRRVGASLYIDNLETFLLSHFGNYAELVTANAYVETPQGKRFTLWEDNPHLNS